MLFRRTLKKRGRRILISSLHHLGDFVAKIPLIKIIKRHDPEAHITILGCRYVEPLVRYIGEVDAFFDAETFFFRKEASIVQTLRQMNLDVCIHLLNVVRFYGPDLFLYLKKAGVPVRIGNIHRKLGNLLLRKTMDVTHNLHRPRSIPNLHEFLWHLQVLPFLSIRRRYSSEEVEELLPIDISDISDSKQEPLASGKFNLLIHPGSLKNAKEWPKKNYRALLSRLDTEKIRVIVTGSQEERLAYADILPSDERIYNAMGRLSLIELIELIRGADAILGSSTGPMHIASLFRKKILTLFADEFPIGASTWRPLGKDSRIISVKNICEACRCKLSFVDPRLCRCMEDISVDRVYEVIQSWTEHAPFI